MARIETEEAEKPAKKAPAPKVEAKVTPPVEEAPKQEEEAKHEEKPQEAVQAPIVVKPPQPSNAGQHAPLPSFGSVSPIMPGGDSAVVVTMPPSGSSQ